MYDIGLIKNFLCKTIKDSMNGIMDIKVLILTKSALICVLNLPVSVGKFT